MGSACTVTLKQGLFEGTEGHVIVGAATSTHLAELVEGDTSGEVPTETLQHSAWRSRYAPFLSDLRSRMVRF